MKYYSKIEVANALGVSVRTLERYINAGKFQRPCTPKGVRPKWSEKAIEHFINANPLSKVERQFLGTSKTTRSLA